MRVAAPWLLLSLGACAVADAPRPDASCFHPILVPIAAASPVTASAPGPDLSACGFDALMHRVLDEPSAASLDLRAEPTAVDFAPADSARDAAPVRVHREEPAPAPLGDDGIGRSYTELRLGWFDPHGDLGSLNTGFWGELAFGRSFLSMLSVEASVGYFDASGPGGNAEVYGIPLMINAKLGVPVAIVEHYVGAGIGGLWAHATANGFSSSDSFAVMYDAFIGIEFGLGGFGVGAEYRYVKSDNLDAPGNGSFQLEGNVFMLTGSLPF